MTTIRREDHRLRILQFTICALIGLSLGRLIGFSETPTIAISAILSLYIDRGYLGTIYYSVKRVAAQIVMGGLVLATYIPLSVVIPPWSAMAISICFSFAVGLSINEMLPFSPLTVSAGDAALIMGTGYYAFDPNYYWQRILFCVLGGCIGISVYFLSHYHKCRLNRIEKELIRITQQMLEQDAPKHEKDASLILAWAKNQLKLWHEDQAFFSKLQGNCPITPEYLTALLNALHNLLEAHKNQTSNLLMETTLSPLRDIFQFAKTQHLSYIMGGPVVPQDCTSLSPAILQNLEYITYLLPYLYAVQHLCSINPSQSRTTDFKK